MCREMALTRIPMAEPDKFDGRDPLSFPLWRVAYEALTANGAMTAAEKLNLLNKYLAGEAKAAVKGFLMLSPEEAYAESYRLLLSRYRDKSRLASDYLSRLRSWPKISGVDNVGLRRYIDFLNQGRTAMVNIKALRVLDDESENFNMIKKLPVWLGRKWTRRVAIYREENEEYPSFPEFVDFLSREDRIAHDPASKALRKEDSTRDQMRSGSFASESHSATGTGSTFGACIYCSERHPIKACDKFRLKPFEFRMRFVRENRLCFGCLNKGHQVRDCRSKKDCEVCRGRHPTVMHTDENSAEGLTTTASATTCASNNRQLYTPRKSSMVVPVYISHSNYPDNERVTFAMIDSQSDSSFVTEETARELGLKGVDAQLSLSTMTSSNKVVKCKRYVGLQIRGYNDSTKINLPGVYSRRAIPINRDHIPCSEMVDNWPHLNPLRDQLMPRVNCKVGLLIGYDCPRALEPTGVLSAPSDGEGPFGMKTVLGWGLVGVISKDPNPGLDTIGHSHRVMARQTSGNRRRSSKRAKKKPKKRRRVTKP